MLKDNVETLQLAINTGITYLQNKNYETAIATFNLILAEDQHSALVFYCRAEAYYHIGKHAEAIQDFRQAEKLGYKITNYLCSESYAQLGNYSGAIKKAIAVMISSDEEQRCPNVAEICLSKIKRGELDSISRNHLLRFIISMLPQDRSLYFLKKIIAMGPGSALGARFWKPEKFSSPNIEEGILKKICEHLQLADGTFVKPSIDELHLFDKLANIPDPIQQLRYYICYKKNTQQDYSEAEQELLNYYSSIPEEGGFAYRFDHITRYIQDFLYLHIPIAENFVELAIEEILRNSENLTHPEFDPMHLTNLAWILFRQTSYFSKAYRIHVSINANNKAAYSKIWNKCKEREKRYRNVTNYKFESEDPIEQLRYLLCLKKNNEENYDEELLKLSDYYRTAGVIYEPEYVDRYAEDFLYLGVSAAENFIKLAIEKTLSISEDLCTVQYPIPIIPQRWIKFQRTSLLSRDCKILISIDQNNVVIYENIWSECYANKDKHRNVTHYQFKASDEREQLRFSLCLKKYNQENYEEEVRKLSDYYTREDFIYQPEHADKYLEDFLYLDICAAENATRLATEKKVKNIKNLKYDDFHSHAFYERWIEFQTDFFADDCKIFTTAHAENYQVYQKIFDECKEKELQRRNVSNRNFYAKDPMDQLRYSLGVKKNDQKDYQAEIEELSLYYLLSPEEGGFAYQSQHKDKYVTDFLYLDISAAESFVRLALENDFNHPFVSSTPYPYSSDYIIELRGGIFSDDCKIYNLPFHKNNHQTFNEIWRECLENKKLLDKKDETAAHSSAPFSRENHSSVAYASQSLTELFKEQNTIQPRNEENQGFFQNFFNI